MIRQLKHVIARWLFSDEVARIELERQSFIRVNGILEKDRREQKEYIASLTVTDMVREQLKGFDPKLLDDTRDLPEILGDVGEQDVFLSKVKGLKENEPLQTIITFLTRNQLIFTAKEALTLREINFGRATINGLSLLREEIDRLTAIYEERHPKGEEYDKHEAI